MNDIMPNMRMVLPGDYCNKCNEFKPEVMVEDMWANNKVVCTSRSIVCKNEALCRHLIDYLKQNETAEESSPDDSEDDYVYWDDYVYCCNCVHYIESCAKCKLDLSNKLPTNKRFCKLFVEKE